MYGLSVSSDIESTNNIHHREIVDERCSGDADIGELEGRFLADAAIHLVEAELGLVHQMRCENVGVRQREIPESSRLARGRSGQRVAGKVCLWERFVLLLIGQEEAPFKS